MYSSLKNIFVSSSPFFPASATAINLDTNKIFWDFDLNPLERGFSKKGRGCFSCLLRLAFTGDGVGVGVGVIRDHMTLWKSKIGVVSGVISLTESELEESEHFHFFWFCLRLWCLWSSVNLVVGVGSRSRRTSQSQGPEWDTVIGLFFPFQLWQCSFHLIVSDGDISRFSVLLPTDSVGLIFTRSYRSTLLIMTLTTTLSLVITSF